VSTRTLVTLGVLVVLVVAGVVSLYASGNPDGLEYAAAKAGLSSGEPSPAEDGALAGYEVRGVDEPRLSGGLAGVAGSLLVLVLAGGLGFAVRRRSDR
jgi:hypothetical protein